MEPTLRDPASLREMDPNLLQSIFDRAGIGMVILGARGEVLRANPVLRRMLGHEGGEELGSLTFVDSGDPDEAEAFGALVRGERDRCETERRYVRRDGSTFHGRLIATLLPEQEGEQAVVLGVMEDVSRLRDLEESLRESEERFHNLMDNAADAFFIHDDEGRIVEVNRRACESLGYTRDEMLHLNVTDIETNFDPEGAAEVWRRMIPGEPVTIQGVYRRKDGSVFPVEVVLSPIEYEGWRMIFATTRDVTARKTLEEQLVHRAFHDPLTGLPNRTLFMDRLQHALARQERRDGVISLLFVDLDDFKQVNDSWGHDAGDRVLIEVGRRLAACVRSGDTVARLGGDEFTVLLEHAHAPRDVLTVVRRLEDRLRETIDVDGRGTEITASIGVASAIAHVDERDLLEHADQAMYRAKRAGKNRHEFHGLDVPADG